MRPYLKDKKSKKKKKELEMWYKWWSTYLATSKP
jgi:hypothetical protein